MKTKDLTQQLSGLLGQQTPFGAPATGPVSGNFQSEIPDELQDPDPIFELNYKSEQKQCIKRAKDSIMVIVKEIVPDHLQNSPLILDKVKQDSEQLGNLYYQYKKKETYHQALMETIACGETEPKRFEVCEKISSSLEDLGSKITDLQNQLRKYYIDTYLDMEAKVDADDLASVNRKVLEGGTQQQTLTITDDTVSNPNNVVNGTDATVKMLQEKKKRMMMQKYHEIKNE